MNQDKAYFPEGLFFKEPHSNAPDFVKGTVSIKVEEFQKYLTKVKGEWLNLDLKVSRDGKAYAQINTFKPDKTKSNVSTPANEDKGVEVDFDEDPDLPF